MYCSVGRSIIPSMAYYKIDGYWKSKHPLWTSYHGMLQRCDNPNHKDYKYYGGRGIGVVKRWRGSTGFDKFVADMGERPDGLTLDRIRSNRWYSPKNCRWASIRTQSINRRATRNTSGYVGVSFHKGKNLWEAYIDLPLTENGKHNRKYLGYFHNLEDAIEARRIAEKERYTKDTK